MRGTFSFTKEKKNENKLAQLKRHHKKTEKQTSDTCWFSPDDALISRNIWSVLLLLNTFLLIVIV
jgi:hypothetical protein